MQRSNHRMVDLESTGSLTLVHPCLFACSMEIFMKTHMPLLLRTTKINNLSYSNSPHWIVFNISDQEIQGHPLFFNCGWKSTIPNCPIPTILHVIEIVQAIGSWLKVARNSKILLVCPDGKARCSIVAAVFLK
jgi:hypothetical protein